MAKSETAFTEKHAEKFLKFCDKLDAAPKKVKGISANSRLVEVMNSRFDSIHEAITNKNYTIVELVKMLNEESIPVSLFTFKKFYGILKAERGIVTETKVGRKKKSETQKSVEAKDATQEKTTAVGTKNKTAAALENEKENAGKVDNEEY